MCSGCVRIKVGYPLTNHKIKALAKFSCYMKYELVLQPLSFHFLVTSFPCHFFSISSSSPPPLFLFLAECGCPENSLCELADGQCPCPNSLIGGRTCNECVDGSWGNVEDGCEVGRIMCILIHRHHTKCIHYHPHSHAHVILSAASVTIVIRKQECAGRLALVY